MKLSPKKMILAAAVAATLVANVAGATLIGDADPQLEKLPFGSIGRDSALSAAPANGGGRSASSELLLDAKLAPWPVDYVVEGKLTEPSSDAPAFRFRRPANDREAKAKVSGLAAALGVEGLITSRDIGNGDAWIVRDDDRTLVVMKDPGLPWYLTEGCFEPATDVAGSRDAEETAAVEPVVSNCVGGATSKGEGPVSPDGTITPEGMVSSDPDVSSGAGSVGSSGSAGPISILPVCPADQPDCGFEPMPMPEPVRPAGLPDRVRAGVVAREALGRLGVPTAGMRIDDGFSAWYVAVPMRAGGLKVSGSETYLAIGPNERVVGGGGWALTPTKLGDYPLVGVEKGLERLRAGEYTGIVPLGDSEAKSSVSPPSEPSDAGAQASDEPTAEETKKLEMTGPGGPAVDLPAPVCDGPAETCEPFSPTKLEPVRITGVHLALALVDDALVPSYIFEITDGGELTPVPAVIDEHLAR